MGLSGHKCAKEIERVPQICTCQHQSQITVCVHTPIILGGGCLFIMSTEFTNPLRKFKLVFLGEQSGIHLLTSPRPLPLTLNLSVPLTIKSKIARSFSLTRAPSHSPTLFHCRVVMCFICCSGKDFTDHTVHVRLFRQHIPGDRTLLSFTPPFRPRNMWTCQFGNERELNLDLEHQSQFYFAERCCACVCSWICTKAGGWRHTPITCCVLLK
jgi:hypothetical protein